MIRSRVCRLQALSNVMPSKKIILDPENLVEGSDHLALHLRIDDIHIHDRCNDEIDDIAEKSTHVDVLDSQLWLFLAVLEAWFAGVHDADVVEVYPEGTAWC